MQEQNAASEEIEHDFIAASLDKGKIAALGEKLRKYKIFEQYEDRFFSLFK